MPTVPPTEETQPLTTLTSSAPALLALVRRGPAVEMAVRGHLALVDASGRLLRSLGDPAVETTLRSASKPLQAASFVESGAAAALGLGSESVAIASSSHHGEPAHVAAARALLAAAGLREEQLRCGVHPPSDPEAAAQLYRAGGTPSQIHNNCSGKHSAMLATCARRGWSLDTYLERQHPLQEEIAARVARHAGLEPEHLPYGTDGCGLPTFVMPLQAFARALASAAASDPAVRECQAAMAEHPFLIGGTTSYDTALLAAAGDRLTAKSGAAALFGAVARDGSWALALKLESGAPTGLPQIATRALQQLDLLPGELPPALAEAADPRLHNWVGREVGSVEACLQL